MYLIVLRKMFTNFTHFFPQKSLSLIVSRNLKFYLCENGSVRRLVSVIQRGAKDGIY